MAQSGQSVRKGRWLRGEQHMGAKLTEQQVNEIRQQYGRERVTLRQLGRQYGVTEQEIGLIVRGIAWRHLLYEEESTRQ